MQRREEERQEGGKTYSIMAQQCLEKPIVIPSSIREPR